MNGTELRAQEIRVGRWSQGDEEHGKSRILTRISTEGNGNKVKLLSS